MKNKKVRIGDVAIGPIFRFSGYVKEYRLTDFWL